LTFGSWNEARRPRIQRQTRWEILQRDPPTRRYGVAVLYPEGLSEPTLEEAAAQNEQSDPVAATQQSPDGGPISGEMLRDLEAIQARRDRIEGDDEPELDLTGANTYKPSTMAVSFLAELREGCSLEVLAHCGRYRPKKVTITEGERSWERVWWLYSPVSLKMRFDLEQLCTGEAKLVAGTIAESSNVEGLSLSIEAYSRPQEAAGRRLITVCLINRTRASSQVDASCLFQSAFEVKLAHSGAGGGILPYPTIGRTDDQPEEAGLELLYRNTPVFGVGHGCAANWDDNPGQAVVGAIRAEALPMVEVPSITPDIVLEDGARLEVPMELLSRDDTGGLSKLETVVNEYENWIGRQQGRVDAGVDGLDRHRPAALRHLQECRRSADRMRDGIAFLRSDALVRKAFRLANLAMLLQQKAAGREPRKAIIAARSAGVRFNEAYTDPADRPLASDQGKWRAFQIAFLLMSLRSAADAEAPDRDQVELIWFPTGGGKTEAYLALAAYSMFLRRLRRPADVGVEVLMRYTLRLLTTQQFQRAARLACAMEYIRRTRDLALGEAPFSVGIWLGAATTPNTRADAVAMLRSLRRPGKRTPENGFLIDRCPWCRAQVGPLEGAVLGYNERDNTVVLSCSDRECPFFEELPVVVIDEDIYDEPPSLIIGTVDKFAMLAWKPAARSIFGLDMNGARTASPPGLIIQDELHLISGPLGSMVGLYETLVQVLCTESRGDRVVYPKLICSTATIRRYQEQVRALYARDRVSLFPPPGLDAGDSFFARYARESDRRLSPGRVYVGVHGPGLGSLQTAQVRSLAILLQSPTGLDRARRDPWWTVLAFFNSLRELGGTLSLLQSDIPDYLNVLRTRGGSGYEGMRRLNHVMELTSRLRNDEVTEAIAALEVATTRDDEKPVDICLASNIIEVGIDIDRLSLMVVVGQPKTTSQYIQVTGRVGRRWWERPGLVVTIYSASKARDRSHFEKFKSYHQRLYAQVEPTSVTPFSRPVLSRALHAVMAGYVRQVGAPREAARPRPLPVTLVEQITRELKVRVGIVDQDEEATLEEIIGQRIAEWERWENSEWTAGTGAYDPPLLRQAGAYADPAWRPRSWATPTSMRDVDAECQAEISALYLNGGNANNA
jgi:hypothetical protein